jgi:inosine-uridine nucleoside N-ribohydrolase
MTGKLIVFDTDMGTDDALAMVLLARLSPGNCAILTAFGNVPEDQVFTNAFLLSRMLSLQAPIFRGAAGPLGAYRGDARDVHGEDGLGGASAALRERFGLPGASAMGLSDLVAAPQFRAATEVHWLSLGPATNLARLAEAHPAEFRSLASVTLMSGVFHDKGNITETAEFNAYADAQGLSVVLDSGRPLTIVPLDICRKVQLRFAEIEAAFSTQPADIAEPMLTAHRNYCRNYLEWEGFYGCFPHDSVALLAMLRPELFYAVTGTASCVTAETGHGTTRLIEGSGPHRVLLGGNLKTVRELICSLGQVV